MAHSHTPRFACRDGVIDKEELKILLHSTSMGAETISKHPVSPEAPVNLYMFWQRSRILLLPLLESYAALKAHATLSRHAASLEVIGGLCHPMYTLQGWISEEEVSNWLSKYDWDKSGDISFAEFAALVS